LAALKAIKPELEKVQLLKSKRSSSVLETSDVMAAIRDKVPRRAWAPLCQSGLFGAAKRDADMYVSVGRNIVRKLPQEVIDCLPETLTALYHLSFLDAGTLEEFVKKGFVSRTTTAEQAKALAWRKLGTPDEKPNVDRRVRNFAQFVSDSLKDWSRRQLENGPIHLKKLIEEIQAHGAKNGVTPSIRFNHDSTSGQT